MRCHEAKRLLNEGDINNRELVEHLNDCSDCAREAKAAGLIHRSLDSLRQQDQPRRHSLTSAHVWNRTRPLTLERSLHAWRN